MFAHHCTACDARHLIFPSQITGLTGVEGDFAVTYQCWCGAEQVWFSARTPENAAGRRDVLAA